MLTLVFKFSSVKKFSFKKHQFFAKTRDFFTKHCSYLKISGEAWLILVCRKEDFGNLPLCKFSRKNQALYKKYGQFIVKNHEFLKCFKQKIFFPKENLKTNVTMFSPSLIRTIWYPTSLCFDTYSISSKTKKILNTENKVINLVYL